jgi:hypothetical protein
MAIAGVGALGIDLGDQAKSQNSRKHSANHFTNVSVYLKCLCSLDKSENERVHSV